MKKTGILLVGCLLLNTAVQAQFLKKLGDKISKKVEQTASENISDKAAKETDETLNSAWETDLTSDEKNQSNQINTQPTANYPESYDFDWKYSVSVDMGEKKMNISYRLKKGGNYIGMGGEQMRGMFMVMDFDRNLSIMYINGMVQATKTPNISKKDQKANENMKYEQIAPKTILGYHCDGYRTEDEDYVMTFYVTDEVGVGFGSLYENQKYLPEGFDPDWINENSLMMEMQMINKKDDDKSMKMTCTEIKPDNFTITK